MKICAEVLVNWSILPKKSAVRLTDRLDTTISVGWDVKPQSKQKNKHFDLPDTPAFTGEHQFNHKCKEASYVAREHIFVDEISW